MYKLIMIELASRSYSRRIGIFLLIACCFGLVDGSSTRAVAQDKIYPIKGSTISGAIQKIAKDAVTIEARSANQNVPSDQIGWIVFEGEAQSAARAKELASRGQFIEAMSEFKKIDKESLKSENAQSEYLFYQGYIEGRLALIGRGDAEKAKKSLLEFIRGNSSTFHFYDTAELLGQLAVQLGQFEDANKYFKALHKAPFPIVAARSRLLESNALLAQENKFAEARTICSELMAMSATEPEVARFQLMARVNVARCDIAEGKTDAALAGLERMVQDNDSSDAELFARINNAIGECYLKLNQPDQAILAYLHTEYFYSSVQTPMPKRCTI